MIETSKGYSGNAVEASWLIWEDQGTFGRRTAWTESQVCTSKIVQILIPVNVDEEVLHKSKQFLG